MWLSSSGTVPAVSTSTVPSTERCISSTSSALTLSLSSMVSMTSEWSGVITNATASVGSAALTGAAADDVTTDAENTARRSCELM